MELGKLPTDNFYIFFSISGIGLIVYFLTLYFKKYIELYESYNETKITSIKLKHSIEYRQKELLYTQAHFRLMTMMFTVRFKINYFDLIESDSKPLNPEQYINLEKADNFMIEFNEINEISLLQIKEQSIADEAIALMEYQNSQMQTKSKELSFILKITFLAMILGFLMSIFGFTGWYFKNQRYQDKIIEASYEMTTRIK